MGFVVEAKAGGMDSEQNGTTVEGGEESDEEHKGGLDLN